VKKNLFFIGIVLTAFLNQTSFAQDPFFTKPKAEAVLRSISADVPGHSTRCLGCHQPNLPTIREWGAKTKDVLDRCLLSERDAQGRPIDPKWRIECLKGPGSKHFRANELGFIATGVNAQYLSDFFYAAYGMPGFVLFDQFSKEAGMPKGGQNSMKGSEFENLLGWIQEGMPFLDELLGSDQPSGRVCVEKNSQKFKDYLKKREDSSWKSYHQDRGTSFFACTANQAPSTCFTKKGPDGKDLYPDVRSESFSKTWNADPSKTQMRLVKKLPARTSFWVRTTPDGKYLAAGLYEPVERNTKKYSSAILDLTKPLSQINGDDVTLVQGEYDPSFTPDGLGFMMQRQDRTTGICSMDAVLRASGKTIDFTETGCSLGSIDTYQSLGMPLNSSEAVALAGVYRSDDAGGARTPPQDPRPNFDGTSSVDLTRLTFNGTGYTFGETKNITTPYLGDWMLGASTEMAVARRATTSISGEQVQIGFDFSLLSRKKDGSVEFSSEASFCNSGAKGTISYDERYFVYHHYVTADDYAEFGFESARDPAFASYYQNEITANIYWIDLKTGIRRRLTTMRPGQVAAFPHFRADGWIYFLVRNTKDHSEWLTSAFVTQ
jgi:hypothetical protein